MSILCQFDLKCTTHAEYEIDGYTEKGSFVICKNHFVKDIEPTEKWTMKNDPKNPHGFVRVDCVKRSLK